MKIFYALIFIVLVSCNIDKNEKQAMTVEQYINYKNVKSEAWDLYIEGKFLKSSILYEKAFEIVNQKVFPNDRYNAACSHSLAGNYEKAFYHLNIIVNKPFNYKNYSHVSTDEDLQNLHTDQRWNILLKKVKDNKFDSEKKLDSTLIKILDTIMTNDSKYRFQIDSVIDNYGLKSKQTKSLFDKINQIDSLNLIRIEKLINKHGWLGKDIVGIEGSNTLFYVLQHSDLETQLKYLPKFREAVKNNKASKSKLAYYEDRISVDKEEKQKYGTQFVLDTLTNEYYLWPLKNVDSVDFYRINIGLGTMKEQAEFNGLTWDVKKHRKRIHEFEENKKKNKYK